MSVLCHGMGTFGAFGGRGIGGGGEEGGGRELCLRSGLYGKIVIGLDSNHIRVL